MTQNKNDQAVEVTNLGEHAIPTEIIVDKLLPAHGMSVDMTKDLSSVFGEESNYIDENGEEAPIVLDVTIARSGEAPVSLGVFRQEIRGGAEDGKTQLLVITGNEDAGYSKHVLDTDMPYDYGQLGVSFSVNTEATRLQVTPTGETPIKITGNVSTPRAFNDEHGPLVH